MTVKQMVLKRAQEAKQASPTLAKLSSGVKNKVLAAMADALEHQKGKILEANQKDIKAAVGRKLSKALIDRLTLNSERIKSMGESLMTIKSLADPVGEIVKIWRRPNGLQVGRMRVPLGVVGIVYESRPNVTVDVAGLCLKSGNAVVLRGGSEAFGSNKVLAEILQDALRKENLPAGSVSFIESVDRQAVVEMLRLRSLIDVIIPRGGRQLNDFVSTHSLVPVIRHDIGNCHVFIDSDADLEMAEKISFNAKVQRPGVCNAMETLLVHKNIAKKFLPKMVRKYQQAGVEIRGDDAVRKYCRGIQRATEKDWYTEYLDLILAVKVVANIDEAMAHIAKYGSSHTEAIVTRTYEHAQRFLREVDSACVMVNASTRFTDGGQFGLGAEMGISTQKLHARGPMALEELTCLKYIVYGNGQIRES